MMASCLHPSARSILDAVASASCSPSTVSTLQTLLFGDDSELTSEIGKENTRSKKPRVLVTSKTSTNAKAPARSRTNAATNGTVTVKSGNSESLTPQEKIVFATETVNATLKSLSQALKEQIRQGRTVSTSRTTNTSQESPQDAQKRNPRTPKSSSQRALKTVSPNAKRTQAFANEDTKIGVVQNHSVTAECSRIAFAYLRTHQKTPDHEASDFQLENGMLALAGKCIGLGLNTIALKELRLLKRRLDGYGEESSAQAGKKISDKQAREKETLAYLLRFEPSKLNDRVIPVVIGLQLSILKIMVAQKRSAPIEAAIDALQFSSPCSPACLLLSQDLSLKTKTARQLESLAQTLLSLCPSVAAADDAACSSGQCVSPQAVFQLQCIAFRTRTAWWKLAGHQPDVQKELWVPFTKCTVAFFRRATVDPKLKYTLAKTALQEIEAASRDCSSLSQSENAQKTAYVALSQMAQAASLTEDAMKWTTALKSAKGCGDSSGVEAAARTIRLASLGIRRKDGESHLQDAIQCLSGNLKGDASHLDALLLEVAGLRKSATSIFMEEKDATNELSTLSSVCSDTIFGCLQFLIRYLGSAPPDDASSPTRNRYSDRLVLVRRVAKNFLESVILCINSQVLSGKFNFDKINIALQDCCLLLKELQGPDADKMNSDYDHHFTRISNLYYAIYQNLSQSSDAPCNPAIQVLRNSIEILRDRALEVRTSANFVAKIDRLAEALCFLGKPIEAILAVEEAIKEHVHIGTLRMAAEVSAVSSPLEIVSSHRSIPVLVKSLRQYDQISTKYSLGGENCLGYYDDPELKSMERGVILELQLGFVVQTLQKSRKLLPTAVWRCQSLTKILLDIYNPEEYPTRRLRLCSGISRLIAEFPNLLPHSVVDELEGCLRVSTTRLSKDAGLERYRASHLAMLRAAIALQKSPVNNPELEAAIAIWQTLVESCNTWDRLIDNIDDVNGWLAQVNLICDYSEMQGLYMLQIPSLHLLVNGCRLASDSAKLGAGHINYEEAQCRLALAYMRNGYSGQTGIILASIEESPNALRTSSVTSETLLRWHITYAEYLLTIGSVDKCGQTLQRTEELARDCAELAQLSSPTATSSSRIRLTRLLAEASYVCSRYLLESGRSDEAFRCARNCVKLNQRVWVMLESRTVHLSSTTPCVTDAEMDCMTRSMGGLSASFHPDRPPIALSMTHDSLQGPAFWSLVPALFRGLSHLSQLYAHHGLLVDAIHYAERAQRAVDAVKSSPDLVHGATYIADLWTRGGKIDDAQIQLDTSAEALKSLKPCREVVEHTMVAARVWRKRGNIEDEIECHDEALAKLEQLMTPKFLLSLQKVKRDQDLVETLANMTLSPKPKKAAKGRKAAAPKTPAKSTRKTPPPQAAMTSTRTIDNYGPLLSLRSAILRSKSIALLMQDMSELAAGTFEQAQQNGAAIPNTIVKSRLLFSEASKQIGSNLTFSALFESTIALPALAQSERRPSQGFVAGSPIASKPQSKSAKTAKTAKRVTTQKTPAEKMSGAHDFAATLQSARDALSQIHGLNIRSSSTAKLQEVSRLLGSTSVLLSATTHIRPQAQMHPLSVAFFLDSARIRVSHLEQSFCRIENETTSKERLLRWPEVGQLQKEETSPTTPHAFHENYIEVLPPPWTAISMSLNDAKDELLLVRYRSGQSPFIIRLPMARHKSRDLDEEIFDFRAGQAEMHEIIDLANFSAHDAGQMNVKGAKAQWWAEREAVDKRLAELLVNIENIWLGGFRGVFAQQHRELQALARFQNDLQKTLDKHLPSRQSRGASKLVTLDSRILELFTGLGDPSDGLFDLDEPLQDLMYFVVDILQFNGEKNAYDEIDWDSLTVETTDALRNYHSSVELSSFTDQHTILILDKHLHCFPWESLPSLRNKSISRLPSLAALRQRILAMQPSSFSGADKSSTSSDDAKGHFISRSSGASILNPSGDLTNTQSTMQPLLTSLPCSWTHTTTPAPSETEMSSFLSSHNLMMYFGHGSGAQYIRPRAVKRIPNAPTTWLMGCSSAAVSEHDEFEPSGMILAYLTAGAPAVVGTLWDVTDKDCDRASVKAGELWGLWDAPTKEDKTSKKGKGKQKEVEKPSGTKVAARRRLFEKKAGETSRGDVSSPNDGREEGRGKMSLVQAVTGSRDSCYLRYLNGAALVVYGIPVYLED